MFSLQTIFGKGDKFYGLLEASARAAHQSSQALVVMLRARGKDIYPPLPVNTVAQETSSPDLQLIKRLTPYTAAPTGASSVPMHALRRLQRLLHGRQRRRRRRRACGGESRRARHTLPS